MSYLDKVGLSYFWTKVKTLVNNHINNKSNPHSVTKTQIGLGNVDNTSDSGKPISTATQNALNNKVDKVVGKGLSTNDYTTDEKNKLASLGGSGTYYDYAHNQGGNYDANNLMDPGIHRFIGAPGSMTNFADSSVMTGNFDMLVESGLSGRISQKYFLWDESYYMRYYSSGNGWTPWKLVSYMVPDQINKLNSIESGANKTIVDSAMSSTSLNPVQNKVLYSQLSGKLGVSSNATSASRLYAKRNINGLSFDGSLDASGWCNCSTSAPNAAKVVTLASVTTLVTGCCIHVRFQYGITVDDATLNVSGTGAKSIIYKGKPLQRDVILQGDVVELVYYSDQWIVIGDRYLNGEAKMFFSNAVDFNSYTKPGIYIIHRSGETMVNGPGSSLTGWLEVKVNQDVITQTYTDYTGRLINIRGCWNNTWQPWVTYSGAFSPTVGGTLNFASTSSGYITRNLSYQQVIGDRCFADISFQCTAVPINTSLKFTNYYTPVSDFDGRFVVLSSGTQIQYSVSTYANSFTLTPTAALGNSWWIRGQISYRTDGTLHV